MQKIPLENSGEDNGENIFDLLSGNAQTSGASVSDPAVQQNKAADFEQLKKVVIDYFAGRDQKGGRQVRALGKILDLAENAEGLKLEELKDIEFELQALLSLVQKLKNERLS